MNHLSAGSLAKGAQGAQVVMNSFQFCATLTVHWWKLQLLSLHLQKQEAQELQGISLKGGLRRANPT